MGRIGKVLTVVVLSGAVVFSLEKILGDSISFAFMYLLLVLVIVFMWLFLYALLSESCNT